MTSNLYDEFVQDSYLRYGRDTGLLRSSSVTNLAREPVPVFASVGAPIQRSLSFAEPPEDSSLFSYRHRAVSLASRRRPSEPPRKVYHQPGHLAASARLPATFTATPYRYALPARRSQRSYLAGDLENFDRDLERACSAQSWWRGHVGLASPAYHLHSVYTRLAHRHGRIPQLHHSHLLPHRNWRTFPSPRFLEMPYLRRDCANPVAGRFLWCY